MAVKDRKISLKVNEEAAAWQESSKNLQFYCLTSRGRQKWLQEDLKMTFALNLIKFVN